MDATTARLLVRKKFETQINKLDEDITKKVREAAESGKLFLELTFPIKSHDEYEGSDLFLWDTFLKRHVEASGFRTARYPLNSYVSIFINWE